MFMDFFINKLKIWQSGKKFSNRIDSFAIVSTSQLSSFLSHRVSLSILAPDLNMKIMKTSKRRDICETKYTGLQRSVT